MKSLLVILVMGLTLHVQAQDSSGQGSRVRRMANSVYNNYLLVKTKGDMAILEKSEAAYKIYAGKKIRNIYVEKLGFGENVNDSSRHIVNRITRLADNLMTGTKAYILKQFLFIHEGGIVDPFLVADNERLLRQLDFIKDARIELVPAGGDEVDLVLRVRDVFSIGFKGSASGLSDMEGTLYDANLFGWAQRLEYGLRYDSDRNPKLGSRVLYRKYNIAGSFINGELFWSGINTGTALGREYESNASLKLDRPLYTPNARWAGGLELSSNKSVNRTEKPDSLFHRYAYRIGDIWLGYNFGTKVQRLTDRYAPDNRRRKMASIRYYNQHFSSKPDLPEYLYRFSNKKFLLGNFSWYKQNFIRTNYIYGFGRTEDLPVGVVRRISVGRSSIDSLNRLYLGAEVNRSVMLPSDHYFSYSMALGTNKNAAGWSDNTVLTNINWMSPLYEFRRLRWRQTASISYTAVGNRKGYDYLYLYNDLGLEKFGTDSAFGTQRLTGAMESMVFSQWQLLGFRIGFFAFARASLLAGDHQNLLEGKMFSALGGGFRTRNENLIFGTIEGRFTYYPRTLHQINPFAFTLNSNLRLRFTESYAQPPWLAAYR